jgi:hypothetical protein
MRQPPILHHQSPEVALPGEGPLYLSKTFVSETTFLMRPFAKADIEAKGLVASFSHGIPLGEASYVLLPQGLDVGCNLPGNYAAMMAGQHSRF